MRRVFTALLACWCSGLPAQQIGQNVAPGAAGSATFSTAAQLVVETVGVRDKQGNAIEGLTAKDFTVTEDGVPQKVTSPQDLPEHAEIPINSTGTVAARVEAIHNEVFAHSFVMVSLRMPHEDATAAEHR